MPNSERTCVLVVGTSICYLLDGLDFEVLWSDFTAPDSISEIAALRHGKLALLNFHCEAHLLDAV